MRARSERTYKIFIILGTIFLMGWFIYNYFGGDHIKVNEGLGWDGATYGSWARDNPLLLAQNKQLTAYYVQRILPSTLVHYSSKLLHYHLTTSAAIVHAFYLYDCLWLIICTIIFWRLAKYLQWNGAIFIIGFASLFLNFSILKMVTWYPTLTDTTAFALALVSLYFYFKDRLLPLILVSFFAAFVFPSMIYAALPLIIFKIKNSSEIVRSPTSIFDIVLAAAISLLLTSYAAYLVILNHMQLPAYIVSVYTHINSDLLAISVLCLLLYLFFALRGIVDYKLVVNSLKYKNIWVRVLWAIVLLLIIHLLITKFSQINNDPGLTSQGVLIKCLLLAIVNPGMNLVAHATFFGPAILLIIIFWKQFCAVIKEKGAGIALYVFLYIILGLNSESRILINAWPAFVILLCEMLKKYKLSNSFSYVFVLISILTSIVYMHWTDWFHYPYQQYGPLISNSTYIVYLILNFILLLGYYRWFKVGKYGSIYEIKNDNAGRKITF